MEDKFNEENSPAFFDKPKNVKIFLYTFYGLCALLFILDLVVQRKIYHEWETLIGFHAIFGFVGCVVLVLLATWMRTWLIRPEDYYSKHTESSDAISDTSPKVSSDANSDASSDASKDDKQFSTGSDS